MKKNKCPEERKKERKKGRKEERDSSGFLSKDSNKLTTINGNPKTEKYIRIVP